MYNYKWKPSKTARKEYAETMDKIAEFCKQNDITHSLSMGSYYFTLNGKNYRVSNHTIYASDGKAFDEFGNQVRELYHENDDIDIYITASKTRLIDIYNDIKNGYDLDKRGNRKK